MEKVLLVEGMTCQNCVKHVQKAIDSIKGVKGIVDLTTHTATIMYQHEDSIALVKEAIKEAGYKVVGEE